MVPSGSSNQELCEDDDIASSNLKIEVETCGNCNPHCNFEPGQSNAVTIELTITNKEVNSRFFCVSVDIDTDHTEILSNDLPACDKISGKKGSDSYTIEVYHDTGPDGDQESLSFDVFTTPNESDCKSVDDCEEMDSDLKLNVDIESKLEFEQ
jgi:hypothetical protein